MFYIFDLFKKMINENNWGILIYLILNVSLIILIFSPIIGVPFSIILYIISVTIALSSIGEKILRFQIKAKPVEKTEYYARLKPLFDEVYQRAKLRNPKINDNVQLFVIKEDFDNAYATGRMTVCITSNMLRHDDEIIKATLAHEFGHLSNKDTDLLLFVTVGNLAITAVVMFFRFMFIMMTMFRKEEDVKLANMVVFGIINIIMWFWTKIGVLLVMYSSRKNEYNADMFSVLCGYKNGMISTLRAIGETKTKGLWANLASSHPETSKRIDFINNTDISTYTTKSNAKVDRLAHVDEYFRNLSSNISSGLNKYKKNDSQSSQNKSSVLNNSQFEYINSKITFKTTGKWLVIAELNYNDNKYLCMSKTDEDGNDLVVVNEFMRMIKTNEGNAFLPIIDSELEIVRSEMLALFADSYKPKRQRLLVNGITKNH